MALAAFDVYCSESVVDRFEVRRWLPLAVMLSLGLHAALLIGLRYQSVDGIYPAETMQDTPAMVLRYIQDLPPMAVEEEEGKLTPNAGEFTEVPPVVVPIPVERPGVELKPDMAAGLPGNDFSGLTDGPPLMASVPIPLPSVDGDGHRDLDRHLRALTGEPMNAGRIPEGESPVKVDAGPKDAEMNAHENDAKIPGLKSIDEALQQTGTLLEGEGNIGVGGALFEYNRYELLPAAVGQLRKLAELIQRNPQAIFTIEGHTDGIGTPEYNQELSEKRAMAVKQWLVQFLGIAPDRIETKGFGSSKLIVPGDGSVEAQQPNRRVEISIRPAR